MPLHLEKFHLAKLHLLDNRLCADHEDDATVWAEVLKSLVPAVPFVGYPEIEPSAWWKRWNREFGFDWDGGYEILAVATRQVRDWTSLERRHSRPQCSGRHANGLHFDNMLFTSSSCII